AQAFERPGVPVSLCNHSRELTGDVVSPCKLSHLLRPWLQYAFTNPRLSDVIQNEFLIRMRIDKSDRLRKMPLVDQNVVNQPCLLNPADTEIEILALQKTVRLCLNDMP